MKIHELLLKTIIFLTTYIQAENIIDFLRSRPDLSQFLLVLQQPGLHKAYTDRQITVFVPTDASMLDYRGRRGEDFALNHIVNSLEIESALGGRLSSLVAGGPPIWVTKRSAWIYFNQARVLEKNIFLDLGRGEQQVVYIIDSVLEPLLPISIRNHTISQDITAAKLLERSTLYNLGDRMTTRTFFRAAEKNNRARMFSTPGRHTFFIPVDYAFQEVDEKYVDVSVVEAHIIPGELLLTTLVPTKEYRTVTWAGSPGGVRVNVSLQPSILPDGQIKTTARSNTIRGDRVHAEGLVVSRIVKGNIPVQNGIVHLIDKPLMVVATSLYEYIKKEGSNPRNRLYRFAQLIEDKGGDFKDTLIEAKSGTLLAPSNEAFRNVDRDAMNIILAPNKDNHLRQEFLGLHFTRERLSSNNQDLLRTGDRMYSSPASFATNRIFFQYIPGLQKLTVEGRGVNATVVEADIGTMTGVIHVIDTVLGIPNMNIADKLSSDPTISYTWSLAFAVRLSKMLSSVRPNERFTFIAPSNEAWNKVKAEFPQAFRQLTDLNDPDFAYNILLRHLIVSDQDYTIEQLVYKSNRSPSNTVMTQGGALSFTEVGSQESEYRAYTEYKVSWGEIEGRIVRANLGCKNGYIHLVDKVMMDNNPAPRFLNAATNINNNAARGIVLCLVLLISL